jgi:hypothetical protein
MVSDANLDCAYEIILHETSSIQATEPTDLHKHTPREAMQGHVRSFEQDKRKHTFM